MNYRKKLLSLMAISLVVRCLMAAGVELGNDEVYYRIFALFPDWSYFDHPPLVAWLVRLTTLGQSVVGEMWVRLGSIIIGTINTYLIFRIAGGGRQGFIASLLYTGSIYCSVIVGTFIMPDTPMSLFWLLALWLFGDILPQKESFDHRKMLLAGAVVGLAMLGKYTGGYLWVGAGLYILIFNRKWLSQWSLWVAMAVSVAVFVPVIWWNVANDFISFTFHSGRVTAQQSVSWLYVGRELLGGVGYNNPVNWLVALLAIVAWARGRRYMDREKFRLWLMMSLPMIFLFLGVSLTRETLPHWAAPAYFALILVGAAYLGSLKKGIRWAYVSVALVGVVYLFGYLQINYGVVTLDDRGEVQDMGRRDFSLDTYGWRQGGEKFAKIYERDVAAGVVPADVTLLQYGWDDAAHVDCYFGLPLGLNTKTIAPIASTHYYEWINARRGGHRAGEHYYLVVSSRYALDPEKLYSDRFNVMAADTIPIVRSGRHVMNFYLYRLK